MKLTGNFLRVVGVTSVAASTLLMVGSNSGAASRSHATLAPVKIGISLSLSGDFSADGIAYKQGYELWAKDVNAAGGLLGHKVSLDIVSDASSPTQVVTNYQHLISVDHVALTFGPFSTLLTLPSAQTAARNGYALVEGAGGGPSVFSAKLHNVFDVTLPVAYDLAPFAKWVTSLPAASRPTTIAYATSNDPFTQPVVDTAETLIAGHGIKTVYNNVFPAEATDFTSIADAVVASKAQAVVIGSVDVPTVSAFMQAFEQAHYTPKVIIATAGPDAASQKMVAEYIKQYGGTAAGVNADIADAYSVGQVMAAAVKATGGFNNAKIISYLHSGVTIQSVQGGVRFNSVGENLAQTAYTFQWQKGGTTFVEVNPVGDKGAVKVLYPKPAWGK